MNEEVQKEITVIKRDGREVKFQESKVTEAIRKAMLATPGGVDEVVIEKIVSHIGSKYAGKTIGVEVIQDYIEKQLMTGARKDVAKEYIKYRHRRDVARESKTTDIFMSIINAESNDITRENANMNADTPAGMMMKFASETTKPFVSNYLLTEEARLAMSAGIIHPHDLDYYCSRSL